MFVFRVREFVATVSPVRVIAGSEVLVRGGNFLFSSKLSCRFNFEIVSARFENSNKIRCTVPKNVSAAALDHRSVVIEVANNGIDFTSNENMAELVDRPRVFSVVPTRVAQGLAVNVTVTGTHFIPGSTWCRLGLSGTPSLASTCEGCSENSTTAVACPLTVNTEKVGLHIIYTSTNNRTDYSTNDVALEVVRPPVLIKLSRRLYL